jgi:hypothetical protein
MRIILKIFLLCYILLLTTRCNHPKEDYCYKSLSGWAAKEPIELKLNLDTAKYYNMDLCLRVDYSSIKNENFNTLPLIIIFQSPSGKKYADKIELPFYTQEKDNSKTINGYRDIKFNYLKNISSKECGKWKIIINQREYNPDYKYIMGIGISVKETKNE